MTLKIGTDAKPSEGNDACAFAPFCPSAVKSGKLEGDTAGVERRSGTFIVQPDLCESLGE
jgi:hypothetical protein